MSFEMFTVSPKGVVPAPNGNCIIQLGWKIASDDVFDILLFVAGDMSIGSVTDAAVLKKRTASVALDLRRLGDGPQIVTAIAMRVGAEEPEFESDPFTVLVSNVGVAMPAEKLFAPGQITVANVGGGHPEVTCVIEDELGDPLTGMDWSITAFVDGKPMPGATVTGANVRFVPERKLAPGRRRIEFVLATKAAQQRRITMRFAVLVDMAPPLCEADRSPLHTSETRPAFLVRTRDAASGVDESSFRLSVDGQDVAITIERVDPPLAPSMPPSPIDGTPTRCASVVRTMTDLRGEIVKMSTGRQSARRLTNLLMGIEQAVDLKFWALARLRLGAFITELVRPARGNRKKPDDITAATANSLICGATNVLLGLGAAGPAIAAARPQGVTSIADLRAAAERLTGATSMSARLRGALESVAKAIAGRAAMMARMRTAHFMRTVIEVSNRAGTDPGGLAQEVANELLAGAANVLLGLGTAGAGSTAISVPPELTAMAAALATSAKTTKSFQSGFDDVRDALVAGDNRKARRQLAEMVAAAADAGALPSKNPNRISSVEAAQLIDATMRFLVALPLSGMTLAPPSWPAPAGTLEEVAFQVADLVMSDKTRKALLDLVQRAATADDDGVKRLTKFVTEVVQRSNDALDKSADAIDLDDAGTLLGGAANLLIGRVPWITVLLRPKQPLTESMHTVAISVADRSGNRSLPAARPVCVDTTAPVVVATVPASAAVVNASSPIEVLFNPDLSGVAAFTLALDGVDVSATAMLRDDRVVFTPHVPLTDGDHVVAWSLTDRAGNRSEGTLAFLADAVPPVIDYQRPAPNLRTNVADVMVWAQLTDARSGVDPASVQLLLDGHVVTEGVEMNGAGLSCTWHNPDERAHTVEIRCADNVGNRTKARWSFTVDRTPANVVIDPALDMMPFTGTEVTITGTVSEPAAVFVNGNAATVTDDLSWHARIPLAPGFNHADARAVDAAGNESAALPIQVYGVATTEAVATGLVLDEEGKPVAGLAVTAQPTGLSTITNHHGRFLLRHLPASDLVLEIDPRSAGLTGYAPVRFRLTTTYGAIAAPATPIWLLRSALGTGTAIASGHGPTVVAATDEPVMTVTVPAAGVRFPEGAPSVISMRAVRSDRLPVDLPAYIPAQMVGVLEPSGTEFAPDRRAAVTLPNRTGHDAGTIIPLALFNHVHGTWELGGFGKVTDDGLRLESLEGHGLRHFSIVAAAPLGARIEPLREETQSPGADALKGALEQSLVLPSFRVNGTDHTPTLSYSSMTAAPTLLMTGVFKGMKEFVDVPVVNESEADPINESVLKARIHTTVRRESGAWPEAITSRYHFADIDTGEFTLQGPMRKRGPVPLPGRPDTRESYPTLPENMALTYLLEPRLADGAYYPTGLYNFLARYDVKGRAYQMTQTARVASSLLIDPTWRQQVADMAAREPGVNYKHQLEVIAHLERMAQPGGELSVQYGYSGPLDYLFRDDAGCVVVHNLSTSPFGRGWWLKEIEQLHPLGRSRVLATGPDGRQVFTVRQTIQTISQGTYGAVALSADGQCVVGASVNASGVPGGTVSWRERVRTLPSGAPTDPHVNYQRQRRAHAVYRTVTEWVQVGSHQEFRWPNVDTVSDFAWVSRQEIDHTEDAWSDWTILEGSVNAGGTASWLESALTLPSVARTDHYVNYQRQKTPKDEYRTVYDWVQVGSHQEFYYNSPWDCGVTTINDCDWVPRQEYVRTVETWSEWAKVPAGEGNNNVTVVPQITGIAIAADGTTYVSDRATHRIFRVSPSGQLAAIAGRLKPVAPQPADLTTKPNAESRTDHSWSGMDVNPGFTPDGTPFAECLLNAPGGLALDPDGNLLFAETGSNRIRRLNFATGLMETVAGSESASSVYDPTALRGVGACLPSPRAIACTAEGDIYFLLNLGMNDQAVGMIDRNGFYHHLVGKPDGTVNTGVAARLYRLIGAEQIAVDAAGRLFISVPAQNIVLMVDAGVIEPVAGSGEKIALPGDGGPALQASLVGPRGIAVTPEGNLIVADPGHGAVRLVSLGLGALGWTELQGAIGYFGSTLRREPDGTWVRKYKDGSVSSFDAAGRHVMTADRNDNRTQYVYDAAGRLTDVGYPRGAFLRLRYSMAGTLADITDHAGRVTAFTAHGPDLEQAALADGSHYRFTYDDAGRIVAQIDGLGIPTHYTYNEYSRLVARSRGDQTVTIARPDDAAAGNRIGAGNAAVVDSAQTSVVAPDTSETKYAVENGLLTESVSANGESMKITYGANGLPAEVIRPNNKKQSIVYNQYGDILEQHDEAFQTVEKYEYDDAGRKTRHVDASGRVTRWVHDAPGNVIEVHLGGNFIAGTYEYDPTGLVTGKQESGVTTHFEYDVHGNLIRERRGIWDVRYERDAAGNATARIEGNVQRSGYMYDAFNRLVAVDESQGRTGYRYDATGNLIRAVDPVGGAHAFEYDARRNLTKRTDPTGRTWEYQYDANDQKIAEIAPDGTRIEHSYDNNFHTQRTIVNGTITAWARCPEGSLLWVRDEASGLRNHFDAAGRDVAQEIRLPGFDSVTVNYELDPSGKRTAVHCLGNTTAYRYDEAGNLVELRADDLVIQLQRDADGRIAAAVRGNGVATRLKFDGAGHISEIVERGPDGDVMRRTMTFDAAGDCSAKTEDDAAWSFEYDGMGQLSRAVRDRDGLTLQYRYDAKGNRLMGPGGVCRYDEHGILLLEDDDWIYRYDANGNLIGKTSKANPHEVQAFEYSPFGQLTVYRREDGGAVPVVTARYSYDPTGRRIGKHVEYRDQPEKNATLWWIYDGDNIFLELDAGFNVLRRYVYTEAVDSAFGFIEGNSAYYFVRGHLGSVEAVLDVQGAVVARYEYDPFGNLLHEEGMPANRIRYTGREWDEESGTYYYRNRQYDPRTGRFLQPDPQRGDPRDPLSLINRYLYCRNSPLRYVDPTGLSWLGDFFNAVAWVVAIAVAIVVVVVILVMLIVVAVIVATVNAVVGLLSGNQFVWEFPSLPLQHVVGLGFGLAFGVHALLTGGNFNEEFAKGWKTGMDLWNFSLINVFEKLWHDWTKDVDHMLERQKEIYGEQIKELAEGRDLPIDLSGFHRAGGN